MTRHPDDMAAQALLSRLGRGSDHAKRKAALADELGWTEREVKRVVRELRLDGWLVLSGNDGYWLDGSPQEWLARQRSQIHSMWRTYRAVRRTYRTQDTYQETLFSEDVA
jgi:biotin operon repressor